ncbi:MAG: hypothetical protein H7138_20315 [Myxococcales bacterium]|nr:hypothetical protein [Myxococcales bacterium]
MLAGAFAGCAVDAEPTAEIRGDDEAETAEQAITAIEWSSWLDRDSPSGNGEFETRADFSIVQVGCSSPVAIEATTLSGVPWQNTGEVLTVSPSVGLICQNSAQPDGSCQDYRVRFGCNAPDWSLLFRSWHANNSLSSGDIEHLVPSNVPVPVGRFVDEMTFENSGFYSGLQLAPNDAHYTEFGSFFLSGRIITAMFNDRLRGSVTQRSEVVELTSSVLRIRRF